MKNKSLLQFCLVGIVCMVIATGSTIAYFNYKEKEQVPVQTQNAVDTDENMDSTCATTIEEVVEESEEKQKEEPKEEQKEVSKEDPLQKAKANTTKDKNVVRPVEEKKNIKSVSKETTDTADDTTVEITSGPSSDAPDMANNNEVQNAPEQPVQPSATIDATTSTTTDATVGSTTGDSSQPVKAFNPKDIPDTVPPIEYSQEWHDMWLDINDPSQWDAVVQDVIDNITEKYPPVENNQ